MLLVTAHSDALPRSSRPARLQTGEHLGAGKSANESAFQARQRDPAYEVLLENEE
jgi:hypothetical protein